MKQDICEECTNRNQGYPKPGCWIRIMFRAAHNNERTLEHCAYYHKG